MGEISRELLKTGVIAESSCLGHNLWVMASQFVGDELTELHRLFPGAVKMGMFIRLGFWGKMDDARKHLLKASSSPFPNVQHIGQAKTVKVFRLI